MHGAYGAGRLRIGPSGDFATAPSLGPDFAALLAPQLADWLTPLAAAGPGPLALWLPGANSRRLLSTSYRSNESGQLNSAGAESGANPR